MLVTRAILYSYFELGDKPTPQQFQNLIDSLFHKGEDTIKIQDVEGLQAALNEAANSGSPYVEFTEIDTPATSGDLDVSTSSETGDIYVNSFSTTGSLAINADNLTKGRSISYLIEANHNITLDPSIQLLNGTIETNKLLEIVISHRPQDGKRTAVVISEAITDTTAPTLTFSPAESITAASFSIPITTDENGTVRWALFTNETALDSIIASESHVDIDDGTGSITFSDFPITTASGEDHELTGLDPSTAYFIGYYAVDAANNKSTITKVSTSTIANQAPTVSNIVVTANGNGEVGDTFSFSYDFNDPDGHAEGASIVEWYKFESVSPISLGQTGGDYTSQPSDENYTMVVRVTPVDELGLAGTPMYSSFASPVVQPSGGGDVTAPNLSNIGVSSITDSTAVLTVQSNEASDIIIAIYSDEATRNAALYADVLAGTGSVDNTLISTSGGVDETFNISGLSASTNYYFRIFAEDAADNQSVAYDGTFATTAAAGNPVASNVTIHGSKAVGKTLSGNHDYSSPVPNAEGATIYKFYRSDNEAGLNEIEVQSSTTNLYTLVAGDQGKVMRRSVVPVDSEGNVGAEVFSEYTVVIEAAYTEQIVYDFENPGQEFTNQGGNGANSYGTPSAAVFSYIDKIKTYDSNDDVTNGSRVLGGLNLSGADFTIEIDFYAPDGFSDINNQYLIAQNTNVVNSGIEVFVRDSGVIQLNRNGSGFTTSNAVINDAKNKLIISYTHATGDWSLSLNSTVTNNASPLGAVSSSAWVLQRRTNASGFTTFPMFHVKIDY